MNGDSRYRVFRKPPTDIKMTDGKVTLEFDPETPFTIQWLEEGVLLDCPYIHLQKEFGDKVTEPHRQPDDSAYITAKELFDLYGMLKSKNRQPRESEGLVEEEKLHDTDNFTRALTLVYERRRCSRDMLKAHFGSTVSAGRLLTRLKKGGYISKPMGTINWKVNFDKIENKLSVGA